MDSYLSERERRLLGHLLALYEAYDQIPVSSISLGFALGADEQEVDELMELLTSTRHVVNAGAPGFWLPDLLDRCRRDAIAPGAVIEPPHPLVAGPRGRLSELAERAG